MYIDDIVKRRIDEYLELDTADMFKEVDYATIFGGAVRDSICNHNINDVDILCMRNSCNKLIDYITKHGWTFDIDYNKKHIFSLYRDVENYINEPKTFVKIINNSIRRIQFIIPSVKLSEKSKDINNVINFYKKLLKNVDISNCGVSFNGKKVKEEIENSILHCSLNVALELKSNILYKNSSTRYCERIEKFKERKWLIFGDVNEFNSYFEKITIRNNIILNRND